MDSFGQRFAINEFVMPFLSGPALARLCLVHRDFRASQAQFIAQMREMMTIKQRDKRFYFAGKTGSRALCDLVYQWTRRGITRTNLNLILKGAARKGHRELCILARAWAPNHELEWNDMLLAAARGGHRELCELAWSWGADEWADVVRAAARGGHREICDLTFKRMRYEEPEFLQYHRNGMLVGAAEGHDPKIARELCEVARSYGATNWDGMLKGAAREGHRDLCILAKSWGATKDCLSRMLTGAARNGHRDICELAREWKLAAGQRIDYKDMLLAAAKGQHYDICDLAHSWYVDDIDDIDNLGGMQ